MIRRTLCRSLLLALVLLAGCASPGKTTIDSAFNPTPEQGVVYVAPFVTTLVPAPFGDTFFNTFVDDLNANRDDTGVRWFYILKEDPRAVDPAWLAKQVYTTGEVWGYVEDVGCCSAELRVKARLRLFEAGKTQPVAEFYLPLEAFFDLDRTTVEAERDKLALRLADEMAAKLLDTLAKRH
ncbi:MAG TPA: hypothetical protein VI389_06180 [Geobacteraceae bacterium]